MDKEMTIDHKLEEALKNLWDSMTDEQKEKAKACKNMDELIALAGAEGIELPDEMLDAVAGGYIYQVWKQGGFQYWLVVDDKSGEELTRVYGDNTRFEVNNARPLAEQEAQKRSQSPMEIDATHLRALRDSGC